MIFEKKARLISAAVTVLVIVFTVVLLLMMYLQYTGDEPRVWPPENNSELLLEGEYVAIGDVPVPDQFQESPAPESDSEPMSAAEDLADAGEPAPEPAPVITSKVESPVKIKEKPKPEKTGPTKEELAEMEKAKKQKEAAEKINSRVKFNGASQGATESSGKSGSPNGNASTGALSGLPGANLKGRTLSRWANPSATATGLIKIKVRVNRQGNVISSEYQNGVGPVAANEAARHSCVQAALRSKFSVDEDAEAEQTGYIIYRFE
ncbi:MAG: hypothetical protein K2I18_10020 [Paramuribaculum sp.]|nr:hypothetical protein [Paramuribaculum sp.]